MTLHLKNNIIQAGEEFLTDLSRECILECGRSLTAIERSVMKRFLHARVRREQELYRECLEISETIVEFRCELSEEDIKEAIDKSKILDKKLLRDIRLLPIKITFDYQRILPYRVERLKKQITLFNKLLRANATGHGYNAIMRTALGKDEYLQINEEILDLYAEEAYIINSTMKTPFSIGRKDLADRMYCSMTEVGRRLINQKAEEIWRKE